LLFSLIHVASKSDDADVRFDIVPSQLVAKPTVEYGDGEYDHDGDCEYNDK
jgi:hypothetical protein